MTVRPGVSLRVEADKEMRAKLIHKEPLCAVTLGGKKSEEKKMHLGQFKDTLYRYIRDPMSPPECQ